MKRGWPCLVLCAAGLAVYAGALRVPFLYDDATAIVTNRSVFPPPAHTTASGRPLFNLTLAVNRAVGGLDVRGYHAVNLLIHLACAALLRALVARTLRLPRFPERTGTAARGLALASALVWLVHPLQTESVTYLSQRAEALMGLCFLATLYTFARGWRAASVVCCFAGMAAKEVMAAAPLVVLAYDRWLVAGGWRALWAARRRYYAGLAASWLLLAALVASTGGSRDGSAGFGAGVAWWAYAATQLVAIPHYLRLTLWPTGLVFDYGPALVRDPGRIVLGGMVVAGLLALLAFAWRKRPGAAFLLFAFFAILAPSSSMVPVATETMAEHRMYLPLAAIIVGGTLLLHRALGRGAYAVMAAAAVILGGATVARNRIYASPLALWSDTAAKRPENPRAHNELGLFLFQAGRRAEALAQYREALALEPQSADAHYNYGTALLNLGQPEAAAREFAAALRRRRDYPGAETNYGLALMDLGRGPEAMAHYRAGLRIEPGSAPAQNDLGIALAQAGQVAEAVDHFEAALALDPASADARENLSHARRLLASRTEAAR